MELFLPPEIWHRILTFAALDHDCCQLWTNARRVSHEWRSNIAKVYAEILLQDPSRCFIRFDTEYHINMKMTFASFHTKDRSRCVFKTTDHCPDELRRSEDAAERYDCATWNIERYIGDGHKNRRFDLTPHILFVGDKCMDSELVQLSFNPIAGEITFDWEATLARFFEEVMKLHIRDSLSARRVGAHITEDPEFLEDDRNITFLMDAVEGARLDNLRLLRRQRIQTFYGGAQKLSERDADRAKSEERVRLQSIRTAEKLLAARRHFHGSNENVQYGEPARSHIYQPLSSSLDLVP